jgi:hypothetical protein
MQNREYVHVLNLLFNPLQLANRMFHEKPLKNQVNGLIYSLKVLIKLVT